MSNTTVVLIGMALLLAVAVVSNLDRASENNNHDLYCEMVQQFKDTNGQHGWPAYKEGVTCP